MRGSLPETKRLCRRVEWALARALDPAEVLPLLHRLARLAPVGSAENVFAQRRLAELLAESHPWRGALHAKRVLAVQPADDGAWSILALCHALLGHYRCAVASYRRALAVAPGNLAYAHNLGHLIDVALGKPKEALPWLQAAYEGTDQRADVAVSFAHALGRAGDVADAKRVTRQAVRALRASRSPGAREAANEREHAALLAWLDEGAPDERALLPRRPPVRNFARGAPRPTRERSAREKAPSPRRRSRTDLLEAVLRRGLANLPLDEGQRARAQALAHEPAVVAHLTTDALSGPTVDRSLEAENAILAAAIAYAIVYVDYVPLTQADVAACFRVSVPGLRGRFKALRSQLDLTPGDARTATLRPR